jgi:hypothetical protein
VFALKNQTADTIVESLLDVFTRHGTPKILLSDQGRNFESNMVKELCNAMGIDKRRTSPYHPECDGMVERFNRTLLDMLAMYVNDYHSDWDMWIPQVTFAYRTSIHSSTNMSPYEVMYGRKAVLPIDLQFGLKETEAQNYYDQLKPRLEVIKEKVYKRICAAKVSQKKQHDKNVRFKEYKVGEYVWLYNPAYKTGTTPKLMSKWKGPYEIIEKLSAQSYRLSVGETKRSQVIHHNRLKRATIQQQSTSTPAVVESDDQQFTQPRPSSYQQPSSGTSSEDLPAESESNSTSETSSETDSGTKTEVRRSGRTRNQVAHYQAGQAGMEK